MSKVTGIKAMHCVISDSCRFIHGNKGALDIAFEKIK